MQFEAQDRHYRELYEGAQFLVIETAVGPAGRLYLHWLEGKLSVMDIALLPAFRGQGLGGKIMQDLLEQADSRGLKTSIHVKAFNPARRLCERLGMKQVSETGVYLLMETQPKTAS